MKKILIIRCGALGDLVYATSVIDALKFEFGDDTLIDFVSTPGTGGIFQLDTRVNQVFSLKHKKLPIWLSRDKQNIINYSQKDKYDYLINFEYGKQFKSLIDHIQADIKIGANLKMPNIPSHITHCVDTIKYMFKDIVSDEVYKKSFPRLIGTPIEEVKQKYNLPDKYIIISPSNSHQKRNTLNYRAWKNQSWKELILKLTDEIKVVIIGNKGEDEFFDKLKPYPNSVIDLVGKTPLIDLIGVIEKADGLVSTDTGTAHIASSVKTEVFALIGPTPANVTGPYQSPSNKVHILSSHKECSPCYKTNVMKNCKDNICMKDISVEQVFNVIKSAILQ